MEQLGKILLAPVGWLFGGVADVRHWLHRRGIAHRAVFDLPVICVGNLSVGGTGKTPHVEYLIRLLKDEHQLAILSRGYRRKTKGFLMADEESTAESIGDEPAQVWMKYGQEVTVAVGEERALAIPHILNDQPSTDVIIMDDGFQHLAVKPSFSVILTDFGRPFFSDLPLPAGRLRERRWRASDADVIIVTKCPTGLSQQVCNDYRKQIAKYAGVTPVFFSTIRYETPQSIGTNQWDAQRDTLLISGIAKPQVFEQGAKERMKVKGHLAYGDHHHFTEKDLMQIRAKASQYPNPVQLLCTEKDAVKLKKWASEESELGKWLTEVLFYLPISIGFLSEEEAEQFGTLIKGAVEC